MQDDTIETLADALIETAQKAGAIIMRHRAAGSGATFKPDGSPVTAADQDAEALILADLARLAPDVTVVAEESVDRLADGFDPDRPFFLVDPLDGTKDFVRGGTEFTVNIALIRAREPVFGLIYAPASGRLFVTRRSNEAVSGVMDADATSARPTLASLQTIVTRSPDFAGITVLASRSSLNQETAAYIARFQVAETLQSSSSMKFCIVAEGGADLYPRLAPTCEWDTAAGDAILRAAGGVVLDAQSAPLAYGKARGNFVNTGFVAWGRPPPEEAVDAGSAA